MKEILQNKREKNFKINKIELSNGMVKYIPSCNAFIENKIKQIYIYGDLNVAAPFDSIGYCVSENFSGRDIYLIGYDSVASCKTAIKLYKKSYPTIKSTQIIETLD